MVSNKAHEYEWKKLILSFSVSQFVQGLTWTLSLNVNVVSMTYMFTATLFQSCDNNLPKINSKQTTVITRPDNHTKQISYFLLQHSHAQIIYIYERVWFSSFCSFSCLRPLLAPCNMSSNCSCVNAKLLNCVKLKQSLNLLTKQPAVRHVFLTKRKQQKTQTCLTLL